MAKVMKRKAALLYPSKLVMTELSSQSFHIHTWVLDILEYAVSSAPSIMALDLPTCERVRSVGPVECSGAKPTPNKMGGHANCNGSTYPPGDH